MQVSVPVESLQWIRAAQSGETSAEGSPAKIIHDTGALLIEREGRVVRLLGDLETGTRTARVLVAIDDPLGQSQLDSLPLLLGAYVRVEIEGPEIGDVFVLPRAAIREGDRIWLMGEDDTLVMRDLRILRSRPDDTVLVRDSLQEGDRIIISRIGTPLPGMRLAIESVESASGTE